MEKGLPDDELPPPKSRGKEKDTSSPPPPLKRRPATEGHWGRGSPERQSGRGAPTLAPAGGGALVSG